MIAVDQNFVLERPLRRGIQEQCVGTHADVTALAIHRAERLDSRATTGSLEVSARRSITGDTIERVEKLAPSAGQGGSPSAASVLPSDEGRASREPLLQVIAFVGESDGGPHAIRMDSLQQQTSSGMTNSCVSMPSFVLRQKGSGSSASKTGILQQQLQHHSILAPMSFLGRDISTNERVVIYVHRDAFKRGVVYTVGRMLQRLVEGSEGQYLPGVPRLLYCDWEEQAFHCLVVPALGPTLQQLVLYCGGRLSRKSVTMIGIQLLELLRYCHSRDVLINDLSPRNLRFGSSALDSQQIYLASLLFSCTRQHQPVHISINSAAAALTNRIGGPALEASSRSGAAVSASEALPDHSSCDSSGCASQGIEPSRSFDTNSVSTVHRHSVVTVRDMQYQMLRSNNLLFCSSRYPFRRSLGVADDVESVAYILSYCSLGKLPWSALVDEKTGRLTRAIPSEEGSSSRTPSQGGNAVRQLFQQKEQFVLHSSKTTLPGPVKLLLSHLHRFQEEQQPDLDAMMPQPQSDSPNPGESLINFNVTSGGGGDGTSPTTATAAASAAETAIQKTFRFLIAQFRRYLVDHGESEDYRFDWNE